MAAEKAAALLCSLADGDVDSVRKLLGSCAVTPPLVPPTSLARSATFSRSTPPELAIGPELCLLTMSEDAVHGILMQLTAHRDLLALRQTCRALQRLADADLVWETLLWTNYKKVSGGSIVAGCSREVYVEHATFVGSLRSRAGQKQRDNAASAPASTHSTAGSSSVQELFLSQSEDD